MEYREGRTAVNLATMRVDLRRVLILWSLLMPAVLVCSFQSSFSKVSQSPLFPSSERQYKYLGGKTALAYDLKPRIRTRFDLKSSKDSSNNEQNKQPRRPLRWIRQLKPFKRIGTGASKIIHAQARFFARLKALPKKIRIVLVIYMLCATWAVGNIGKKYYQQMNTGSLAAPVEVSYSSFLQLLEEQPHAMTPKIDRVRVGSDRIIYRLTRSAQPETSSSSSKAGAGQQQSLPLELPSLTRRSAARLQTRTQVQAFTRPVTASPELVGHLTKSNVPFSALPAPKDSFVVVAVRTALLMCYALIMFRLYKTMSNSSGGGSDSTPGKLAQTGGLPDASFSEIEGIGNAKEEVMELVDTLRSPEKYAVFGARAPTGLLLVGPPGTGKTMLARATAATAGIPLLYCSGSDFVEMFVGRGAARVRKLFERAEKMAPCIIFVDELDALGKARDSGGGLGGNMGLRSNDEAEQTLNQLLACMDGLDSSKQVCVLAATNRKEVLDQALIRPGRFDRIVKLELPDAQGRERILRVHCSKLPGFTEGRGIDPDRSGSLGKGVVLDLSAVASVTDGLSGAELAFVVNEAAIRAVRRVSAAIRNGSSTNDIDGQVSALDFEESLRNFYETRKPKNASVNDILKNVWKT